MFRDEDCPPESELVVSKVVVRVEGGPHAVHEAGGDPGNIIQYSSTEQYSTVQNSTVPGPPVVGQHPDPGDAALHRLRGLRAAVHLHTVVDSFIYSFR